MKANTKEHLFATNLSDHISDNCELKLKPMCIPTKLQQNIISFTKDGERIARFLTETMQGETPGVKVNHRMDAAKQLIKYGFTNAQCDKNPPLPQNGSETCVQVPSPLGRGLG